MKWLVWLLLFGSASISVNAQEPLTLVWRNKPLTMSMVPGVEKVLVFSEDVQWSIPRNLIGVVTGEAASGVVLLKTSEAFEQARFHFRGLDSNTFYVLDINASATGDTQTVKITDVQQLSDKSPSSDVKPENASGLIELARFTFQWLYAPERLIKQPADVSHVPLKSSGILTRLIVGANVTARPIRQWRTTGALFAVALELVNQESRTVSLDPLTMRSDPRWLSIAALTDSLSDVNTPGERTVVVVLSETPWQEASQWLH